MDRPIAFVLLLLGSATAGIAQPVDAGRSPNPLNMSRSPQNPVRAINLAISPIVEYTKANGSRVRQRGMIIGQDIAPNITLGLGFGELKPRKSGLSPDPKLDSSARKSRKAAIRLNVGF